MTRWFGGGSVCGCARERVLSGRCVLAGGETGAFRHRWEHRGTMPAETLQRKALWSKEKANVGKSKRKSSLKWFVLMRIKRKSKLLRRARVVQLLSLVIGLVSGCATIPKVEALLHTNPRYLVKPDFVGPNGPLTPRQAQQVIDRLKANQGTPTDILQRHMAFEQANSNVPLTFGNKVTLLKNTTATYPAMLSAIRSARDSINIEMFTFSNGLVGQTFADALIERQRHGVQVNLMYDAVGSLGTPASFFDRLKQNGIAVIKYRPLNPFESTLPWTLSHRSHRKNLVVDGRVAFTGGINVAEVYASGLSGIKKTKPLAYWRDTDIKIEGPAVAEFQYLFVDEWNHQKGLLLQVRDYFPKLDRQGNQIVRVIGSVPERFSLIYVTFVSAIINSGSNVYITDAYFAPDRQMLHALEHAARRGVDVRLLLPSIADEPLIVSAARSYIERCSRRG
jgi:cardiolipin synthase A/B